MVVHERGYQRWQGDKRAPVRAAWVILDRGVLVALAVLFRRKLFAMLLGFAAYGPFLFGLGVTYLYFFFSSHPELAEMARGIEEAGMLELITPNPDTVWGYLFMVQKWFALALCVIVGAGLVAEDRRSHALELYLSRPLGRVDYLLGKAGILAFLLAMVTVVPAVVLVLVHLLLHGVGPGGAGAWASLLLATVGAGTLAIAMLTLITLACSALAQRARSAAILLIGALALVEGVVAGLLDEVFRAPAVQLVSLDYCTGQVMAWILGNELELDPDVAPGSAAAVLAAWAVLALVILLRRVRPVEVVA